jgi:hypothetical protein
MPHNIKTLPRCFSRLNLFLSILLKAVRLSRVPLGSSWFLLVTLVPLGLALTMGHKLRLTINVTSLLARKRKGLHNGMNGASQKLNFQNWIREMRTSNRERERERGIERTGSNLCALA